MDFITGFNRDQLVMMDFESAVGPDSWAKVVDMFVDILPMEELGFMAVLNNEGRPPYHKVKHYKNRQACKICPVRHLCTRNKKGRFIERSIYQEALEENQKRVEENPEYYRLRQQVTEHQFGTIKRQWGFTYTLMKGKRNVLSEVNLIMICNNLTRLMSILDPNDLKNRLKRLGLELSRLFGTISAILDRFLGPRNLFRGQMTVHKTSIKSL